jgi:hypothetical protein
MATGSWDDGTSDSSKEGASNTNTNIHEKRKEDEKKTNDTPMRAGHVSVILRKFLPSSVSAHAAF